MKISKKTISQFVARGEQFHKYLSERFDKDFNYDFYNDELNKANWNLYYNDMFERLGSTFGYVLYSLIEYARENELKADHIINALRALNIEVEK